MSKLQEDLKLIVGIKDLENQLEEVQDRLEILSKRFTAYQSGTKAGSGQDGVNSDPDGTETAEDVLDKKDQKMPGGGSKPLTGLEGMYDCDTGKEIMIREDGQPVPPPLWDSATDGPEQGFVPGRYWPTRQLDPDGVSTVYESVFYCFQNRFGGGEIDPDTGNAYELLNYFWPYLSNDQYAMYVRQTIADNVVLDPPGEPFLAIEISNPCGPEISTRCPATAPKKMWPTSNQFQLIKDPTTGLLIPFDLDPNVPVDYQEGKSKVDFCFGDGRTGSREAAKQGGFMYYETDAEGGNPINNVLVFDANGNLLVNADPADIDKYRPEGV